MNPYNLNDGDWQNVIYLVLLLTIMLGGLFSRPDLNFKKILKYLAIWSAIGLVAISAYSYRFELLSFKQRIAGEINPTKARTNEAGQLVINIAQDGHFYVDLEIGQVPVRFMIDTGASDVVIGVSDAIRLGINPKELVFNKRYQTANGVSFGASIVLNEVKIGDVKLSKVGASVNSSEMGVGLLGMSFLRRFSKYEFFQDRLILTI